MRGWDALAHVEAQRPDTSHLPLIPDFASALASRRAREFNGEDGILATRLIEAAQTSAKNVLVVTLT